MTLYEKIQGLCRLRGFEISNLGEKIPHLKVTRGSISGWKKGAQPRADKIKLIADFFEVPVSYFYSDSPRGKDSLAGEGDRPAFTPTDSPLPHPRGDIERELLSICNRLDMKRKNALLAKAYELLEQ